MKQKYPQAPAVPFVLEFTDIGSSPIEIFDGSGTIDMICVSDSTCGVLFGGADMDVADIDNSFPIAAREWFHMTLGPATKFCSVIALDGGAGTFYFYFPGQTEV